MNLRFCQAQPQWAPIAEPVGALAERPQNWSRRRDTPRPPE